MIRLQLAAVLLAAALGAAAQTAQHDERDSSQAVCHGAGTSYYQPITGEQRLKWVVYSTVGPQSLIAGVFSAGIGTAANHPNEYRGTWEGFGKRYGMRLTGVSTGNAIAAGFGTFWGEDPRYFRAAGEPFGRRVRNIVVMTFASRRREGELAPAYARYIGIAGNNFLSNSWRADSEADPQHAAVRTLYGVLAQMGSNAFEEFWPDLKRRFPRR